MIKMWRVAYIYGVIIGIIVVKLMDKLFPSAKEYHSKT
jgi:uncharacterized membrane-anchored protein YhcB (DUF1043 family)